MVIERKRKIQEIMWEGERKKYCRTRKGALNRLRVVMERKEKELGSARSFKLTKHASGKMTKSTIVPPVSRARAPSSTTWRKQVLGSRVPGYKKDVVEISMEEHAHRAR